TGWRVDLAMARRERYPAPGALPEVEPASIEEDLARRDFTVNAIAVTLPRGRSSGARRARGRAPAPPAGGWVWKAAPPRAGPAKGGPLKTAGGGQPAP